MTQTPPNPPSVNRNAILLAFCLMLAAIAILFVVRHSNPSSPPAAKTPGLPLDAIAPDFSLTDAHALPEDPPLTLSLLTRKGPVLIIFYLGYSCPRCVEHLDTLSNLKDDFTAAGLQVIALSPDTPANTRDSIKLYGDFYFPLLYDKDAKVARAFGLREDPAKPLHGAFLIDASRRIRFADAGEHPYTDFGNLISIAKKIQSEK